jgi:Protein of unknown function (DUF3761)
VPASFGRERLKGRVRRHIEEGTNNPDPAKVLAKNRRGLPRADLAHLDLLAASSPAQRRLTRDASIPNPAHLTVRSNQPALAIPNHDHRRRVPPAAPPPAHSQQIGAPPSEPKAKQPRHEHVHQATGGAKPVALRHRLTIAHALAAAFGRRQQSRPELQPWPLTFVTVARSPRVVRSVVLALVAVCLGLVPGVAGGGSPPPGATARCRDGTYSFSKHHSGTCSHHGGVAAWLNTGGTTNSPTVGVGRTVLLATRTQSAGCRRGSEPDRRCLPGAYYLKLTTTVICSSAFRTSSIRTVPQQEKFAVEREYGMKAAYYGYSIEIDHIVSLELGGSNDIANLFPEPGSGIANYHVKDRLENRLHDMVCADQITLSAAQHGIAADWEALYRRLYGVPPTH